MCWHLCCVCYLRTVPPHTIYRPQAKPLNEKASLQNNACARASIKKGSHLGIHHYTLALFFKLKRGPLRMARAVYTYTTFSFALNKRVHVFCTFYGCVRSEIMMRSVCCVWWLCHLCLMYMSINRRPSPDLAWAFFVVVASPNLFIFI